MRIPSTLCAISCLTLLACSSEGGPNPAPAQSSGGQTSSSNGGGGTSAGNGGSGAGTSSGGEAQGGAQGTSGAGGTSGGAPGAGAGGTATGGGGSGSGGSPDDGDTPPWRPLNITAAPEEHVHNVQGRPAAVDNRAPIMMGKLIVDLGVDNGGIYQFGLRRGFHVYGADIEHCSLTYDNLEHNGNCRLETFDGIDRDPEFDLTPETAVLGQLAAHLAELHATYPEEDWGYFLNQDGTVRLSDVGVTGYSHGAQSAARWARAYRLYRAVSRSGPRDNECGTGPAAGDFDPANPPWNPDCTRISAWLHEPSMTPPERLFGIVGKQDGQYGDIMYSMEIMGYIGQPVNISTTQPPYPGDSHRFYADDGHSGFEGEEYWEALGVAWGVPPENMAYAAGL